MENKKQSGSLNRRDLLKVITAAPAAAMVVPGLAGESAVAAQESGGGYQPKFFNTHEYQTVTVLSDWIIPADEHSGSATQAGVPEFMDDWLNAEEAGGGPPRHHRRVSATMGTEALGSLTWIDMECNRLHGNDFVDCSRDQQKQILDRIAYPGKAAPEDVNAAAAFSRVRDLVLGGYFSSKMGIEYLPYLGNHYVEQWNGCPEPDLERLGVSYSEDWRNWKSTDD
ncbi:MAG TPA: gluconate 2-dehydrogenase subunit 3 family protein [Terriglobia bacterium]|nr:gluconate 2-dehydrogenase subunit 3 family protein [Terriglobia bacterium]